MSLKVAASAGHGIYTPGKRTPADEREWRFNDKVVRALIDELEEYEDVEILRVDDPTGRIDVPLAHRTNRANNWGADVYLASHHNAIYGYWFNGGGVETWTYPGSTKSYALAKATHSLVVRAMGLTDRGIKQGNLHEVREPWGEAVLFEGGFMDSRQDILALRNNNKLIAQGRAIATGTAKRHGLRKTSVKAPAATSIPNISDYNAERTPNSIKVEKGDTLYSIGQKYGLKVEYLRQRNNMKDNEIKVGQLLYVDYDQRKNRGRSRDGAYVRGVIDPLGAKIVNRYGSQKSGFTFKDAKIDALTEGDEVYIYETHEGWGRIFTSRTSGDKSNRWIWLERMIPMEIFKD